MISSRRPPMSEFVEVLMHNGTNCYLCGQELDAEDPPEIEHVVPRALGLADVEDISNKRIAHRSCNRTKGTKAVQVEEPPEQVNP